MACGGIEPPYTDFQSVANPSQLTSHVVQFPFFLAPHYTKCKVLLVSGYRHLLNDNRSIQLPVLSLTGILISTCISLINALGVYWQHRQWGREESNLYCLPLGNRFTVCRNTTNRCRSPGIFFVSPRTLGKKRWES